MRHLEAWILAAWLLLAAELGYFIYLGSVGPGAGAVRAYIYAPTFLMGAAVLVIVGGIAWSFLRRPFMRPRRTAAFMASAFVFVSVAYPIPFPAHRENRPSRVEFRMPVEGEWTAVWSGDPDNALRRASPDRRFGLLLLCTVDGSTEGEGGVNYSLDREVAAPAAGEVVRVVDEHADDGPLAFASELGNHVVLEVASDEYFFLCGLRQGSLRVTVGERVEVGDVLGRVGHSADSRLVPHPHLSLHLQDTPEPYWGQGIPWFLHDVEIDGRPLERGLPAGEGTEDGRWTGQWVRAAP